MERYIYVFEDGTIRKTYELREGDLDLVKEGVLDIIKVYPDNADPEIAVINSDGEGIFVEMPTHY